MSEPRYIGSCLCGEIRFEVTGRPLVTFACHCQGCRKMTSGPFSLSSLYPSERFTLLSGEPERGGLRGEHEQMFCALCKSWVFTRPAGMEEFVNVRSALLDQPEEHAPFMEVATSSALEGVSVETCQSFPDMPSDEDWPELVKDYAKWDAHA